MTKERFDRFEKYVFLYERFAFGISSGLVSSITYKNTKLDDQYKIFSKIIIRSDPI